MKPEVILFGLDGATYTVMDDLMSRGLMPNMKKFCGEGVRTKLMSTVPPLTPPAWSTLVTGKSPGNHGILGFMQYLDANSTSVQVTSSRQFTSDTIWAIANQQGKRAGSLNFVVHQPAPKINGWVIPGWVSYRWMRTLSHPPGVIDRLKQELPNFDVKRLALDFDEERKAVVGAPVDSYVEWIGLHLLREQQWFDAGMFLVEKDPVDLLGIVFDGVDKLQHLVWPYLDPALEPEHPSEEFLKIRTAAWSYYQKVDDLLGQTMAKFPDSTILICSDHGFTASWEMLYLNTWLEQQGYLSWVPNTELADEADPAIETNLFGIKGFDWAKTKAYAMTASSNGIYINIKGKRDEHGIAPEDYLQVRTELKEKLLNDCRDLVTGEPLITGVWTREEAFAGKNMENAPDLTIALRDFGFVSVRRSVKYQAQRPMIVGTHHPEGIFIARGPGIRKGETVNNVHLRDITPTSLFAMGLAIPEDVEGRVLEEIYTAEYMKARAPKKTSVVAAPASNGTVNGAAESNGVRDEDLDVLEKMKALGYLE